ncbi:MAG TPA: L-seryl-tRNA(Sec) selenium transferase [Candidatus Polarisedimenticolia bacterium]
MGKERANAYRGIPAVDAVLRRDDVRALLEVHGRSVVTEAVRETIERIRAGRARAGGAGAPDFMDELRAMLDEPIRLRTESSLRRVINATGIVVHTNLGRAILSKEACERVARVASSYSTLEYDLTEGRRGSRSSHIERRLSYLFPDQAALAVNNNAAAVFLALNTLAERREVVISRGELVEIGGSFRIPDVMAKSGARLKEVGTTNRTRLSDYEEAIGPETGLILKVHPSNYRIVGFTQDVGIAELADLAHRHGLPLLVDQGSGCLLDLAGAGVKDEPTVRSILDQGADVVTFSGDKILGGPQAGLLLGKVDLIERMKKSPLHRVLRLDKMTIAALEATLDAYVKGTERVEVPVIRMTLATKAEIAERARGVAVALRGRLGGACEVSVTDGVSRVGGGAAPTEDLPTALIRISPAAGAKGSVTQWEERLRAGKPPVVARIHEDALILDLRTVEPADEEDLIAAVAGSA